MGAANRVAEQSNPANRKERRLATREALARIKLLLQAGEISRSGRRRVYRPVPGQTPPVPPDKPRARRRRRIARSRLSARPAARVVTVQESKVLGQPTPTSVPAISSVVTGNQNRASVMFAQPSTTVSSIEKTESAENSPAADSVSATPTLAERVKAKLTDIMAAATLARLRHREKIWTGWLDEKTHLWRHRPLVAPDGQIIRTIIARRGVVAAYSDKPSPTTGRLLHGYRVQNVRPLKLPAAQSMGRRKRGVVEKPSALKALTARANGRMPCRPGRKRGRPRKSVAAIGTSAKPSPTLNRASIRERLTTDGTKMRRPRPGQSGVGTMPR